MGKNKKINAVNKNLPYKFLARLEKVSLFLKKDFFFKLIFGIIIIIIYNTGDLYEFRG